MEYTEEVINRGTGELETISKGNWITVTEFGEELGLGARQVRHKLCQIGMLEDVAEKASESSRTVFRRRLKLSAVKDGLGKRIQPTKKGMYPFDVLSPTGQTLAREAIANLSEPTDAVVDQAKAALQGFKRGRLKAKTEVFTIQQDVCWLLDHFPSLTQTQICSVISASKQAVQKYVTIRHDQRRAKTNETKKRLQEVSPSINHRIELEMIISG